MSYSPFIYIWNSARSVYAPLNIKNLILRVRYILIGLANLGIIKKIIITNNSNCFKKELADQKDKLGILVWPYIHNEWGFEKKASIIQTHYRCIDGIPQLCIRATERLDVLDLDNVKPGLKIIIDRGEWFKREGELVLNIFLSEQRLYSLAFTLGLVGGRMVAYVGGIQGVSLENIMQLYKEITKSLHGMRPRDFLINVLKIFCLQIGVKEIFAISNKNRHHNHKYFSNYDHNDALTDYDKTWVEQGFEKSLNGFYSTKVNINRRPLTELPSKKRSMYRKRYALLDEITSSILLNS